MRGAVKRKEVSLDSVKVLKFARNGYITVSLLFCVMGVWLYQYPQTPGKKIGILLGTLFILGGAIKMVGYFSDDYYCLAFQFDLALGILMEAVGIIIVARRSVIHTMALFAIFGFMILADSLFRVQTCIDARKFGLNLWWRILIIAFATGTLGVIVLAVPSQAVQAMTRLVGIGLISEGVLNLLVAVFTVKILEICPSQDAG